MQVDAADRIARASPLGLGRRGLLPNLYDCAIFIAIVAVFVLVTHVAREIGQPLARLDVAPVTLDPRNLPEYALRTTLRMFAAIFASLVFTFVVATLAAKSRKAELVIVPALDILQSVPVLGFLTFTVLFFMRLFPGRQLGADRGPVPACHLVDEVVVAEVKDRGDAMADDIQMGGQPRQEP